MSKVKFSGFMVFLNLMCTLIQIMLFHFLIVIFFSSGVTSGMLKMQVLENASTENASTCLYIFFVEITVKLSTIKSLSNEIKTAKQNLQFFMSRCKVITQYKLPHQQKRFI